MADHLGDLPARRGHRSCPWHLPRPSRRLAASGSPAPHGDRPEAARPGRRVGLPETHRASGAAGAASTKSKHYSTRFGELRNVRRLWHYEQMLDRLGVTEDEITVVNHWNHTGTGYDTDAERALASAIYQRRREQHKTHHATETPSWNC